MRRRWTRRCGSWMVIAGSLLAGIGLGAAPAQVPDGQTASWHLAKPDCTVVMSWRQDPTALTASSLDATATTRCRGYSMQSLQGDLTLTDENEGYVVDEDVLPTGYVPPQGPARLHVNETPAKRHVYVLQFSVAFPGTFTNVRPPQCSPAVANEVDCVFEQRVVGLTRRQLGDSPTPTPASFSLAPNPSCFVNVTIDKAAPAGIDVHLNQSPCIGFGVLSVYAERSEDTPLAHVTFSGGPYQSSDAHASFPAAVPAHVYTIAYYETFSGGSGGFDAPGCRTFSYISGYAGERCERTVNVTFTG